MCQSTVDDILPQMQFMLLFSRQGKLRLQKWYVPLSDKERKKISRDLVQTILARKPKMCSFLEWRDLKIVYKRCVSDKCVKTCSQIYLFLPFIRGIRSVFMLKYTFQDAISELFLKFSLSCPWYSSTYKVSFFYMVYWVLLSGQNYQLQ